MPKVKKSKAEKDGVFFLKLVLYLLVGSQWIRIVNTVETVQFALPLGVVIGLLFSRHEHFQIDKKIEYAVLVIACLIGFWAGTGFSWVL